MIDLPLRDPEPAPDAAADRPQDRAAHTSEEPRRRSSGSAMMAVGMLAIGLLGGFAGGFLVGQRLAPPVPPFAEAPRPVRRPAPPPVGADLQVGPGAVQAPSSAPATPAGTDLTAVPPPVAPAAVIEEPVVPPSPAPEAAAKPAVSAAPKPVAPPPPAAGTLQFDSRPNGATIYLDDVRVGVTPMTMRNVRPGTYRVRMELFGHDTWVTTVDMAAGEQRRVGASFD